MTFSLAGRQALEETIQQAGWTGSVPRKVSLKAESPDARQYPLSH